MTTTEPTDAPETPLGASAPGDQGDATEQPEQEHGDAARYRRQLRDTEAERDSITTDRDALRTRVETMQRAEVERVAQAEHNVAKPGAIWAAGTTLADLLDADGNVDQAKAKRAIVAAISDLGLSVRPTMRPDPSQGARGGGGDASSWAEVLRVKN